MRRPYPPSVGLVATVLLAATGLAENAVSQQSAPDSGNPESKTEQTASDSAPSDADGAERTNINLLGETDSDRAKADATRTSSSTS